MTDYNIGDERDDIMSFGRSPMWDGDPVLDRHLLYDQERVATRLLGVEALAKPPSAEMPKFATCAYDGERYKISDGHVCRSPLAQLPGTVYKKKDGRWMMVLETTETSVTYFQIPPGQIVTEDPPTD